MIRIGFGGGCHWCTEAVFQSLKGVSKVQQGWIASATEDSAFSEAVIVEFDPHVIDFKSLANIHLLTHSCTSQHAFRDKYKSAIYTFSEEQEKNASLILRSLQNDFDAPIITQILAFGEFKENHELYLDYFEKHPNSQFCQTYIHPKLRLLMKRFSHFMCDDRVSFLSEH